MKKDADYRITKTDEELVNIINKLQKNSNFADFCNIVISRASKCWQSGLNDYPFGEKNYSDWQSKKTVLEILNIEKGTGSYDYYYAQYIRESLCLYYKIYERNEKFKKISND